MIKRKKMETLKCKINKIFNKIIQKIIWKIKEIKFKKTNKCKVQN